MSLKFSMLLQATDRVTGPAKRIQQSMASLGRAARKLASDLRDPDRAYQRGYQLGSRLRAGLGHLASAFREVGRTAARYAGRAGLAAWNKGAELAGKGVVSLGKKMGGLALGAAKWAAAAAVGAAGFSVFNIFKTAAQFEQFSIMLENMEGSAAKARKAMAWVQDFAQTTPYELDQVMEAYVQLKAYGIDPLDGSLRALGDASAGMSKPLMQSVEALADAVTGEFERLKEFGIRASAQGDKVKFTYMRNGKEMTRTVRKNAADMKAAITGIFSERFGGMMDRQSRTFSGLISNLQDQWTRFQMMVADAGIFDMVKGKLGEWLAKISEMAKDGRLQAWAKSISDWLEKAWKIAVDFVENTDWAKVGRNLQTIADAAVILANAIVRAANAMPALSDLYKPFGLPRYFGRQIFGGDAPAAAGPTRPTSNVPFPKGPARVPPLLAKPTGRRTAAQEVRVGGQAQLAISLAPGLSGKLNQVKPAGDVPFSVALGRSMAGAS